MSKVTYEINRTLCEELEILRRGDKNRDYSMLPATLERIQAHANAMENALYSRTNWKGALNKQLKKLDDPDNEDFTEREFMKWLRECLKDDNNGEGGSLYI